jgi:hypothetical protein
MTHFIRIGGTLVNLALVAAAVPFAQRPSGTAYARMTRPVELVTATGHRLVIADEPAFEAAVQRAADADIVQPKGE